VSQNAHAHGDRGRASGVLLEYASGLLRSPATQELDLLIIDEIGKNTAAPAWTRRGGPMEGHGCQGPVCRGLGVSWRSVSQRPPRAMQKWDRAWPISLHGGSCTPSTGDRR